MQIELLNHEVHVDVIHFERVAGTFSFYAASDADYHGYTDLDFEVTAIKYNGEDVPQEEFDEFVEHYSKMIEAKVVTALTTVDDY